MADEQNQQADETEEMMPGDDGAAAMPRTVDGGMRLQFSFDMPVLPKLDSFNDWSHQALINAALIGAIGLIVLIWGYGRVFDGDAEALIPATNEPLAEVASPIRANVESDYNPTIDEPAIGPGTFVHATAEVVGNVTVVGGVFVGASAVIDSWAGQPIHIGEQTNIQAGAVIGARPTFVRGRIDETALVHAHGDDWAVYIGAGVSIGAGAQVTGPVAIEDGAYIGQGAIVVEATIGAGTVIEPGALVIGVKVPEGRYVPAGTSVVSQDDADALPEIDTGYAMAHAGSDAVAYYTTYAELMGGEGTTASGDEAANSGHD